MHMGTLSVGVPIKRTNERNNSSALNDDELIFANRPTLVRSSSRDFIVKFVTRIKEDDPMWSGTSKTVAHSL
jgi:hypothetical protein